MYGPGESPQQPRPSAGGPPGYGAGQPPGYGAGQPRPPQGPPPGAGHPQGMPPGAGQQGPPQGMPPGGGQHGPPQGMPPGAGQQGYGQGSPYTGGPGGHAPAALAQPAYQQAQQAQQGGQRKASGSGTAAGRVLVVAAAVVLVVTGGVNAVSGPLGYFGNVNIGVLILGGNPLFLAIAQTVLGVAWLVAGALLLTGRRFPWGFALVSAGVFATYESYFIVRGAVIHYVGLFLAIAVFALLHQDAVRRHCKIGPPSR